MSSPSVRRQALIPIVVIRFISEPVRPGMDPKNISIGYQANTKSGSIAVGDNSNAQGSSSVAIGTKSVVTDVASNGVAIGFNSTTSGLSAVAIGGSSSTGKGANASGPASLAIMGTAVAFCTACHIHRRIYGRIRSLWYCHRR